jgi:hypothetical protein
MHCGRRWCGLCTSAPLPRVLENLDEDTTLRVLQSAVLYPVRASGEADNHCGRTQVIACEGSPEARRTAIRAAGVDLASNAHLRSLGVHDAVKEVLDAMTLEHVYEELGVPDVSSVVLHFAGVNLVCLRCRSGEWSKDEGGVERIIFIDLGNLRCLATVRTCEHAGNWKVKDYVLPGVFLAGVWSLCALLK